MFDVMASSIVNVDAMMRLYFDMYGHVDAEFRELIRNRLAMLFKPHLQAGVQGKDLTRAEREEAEGGVGFFGGDEVVKSRLEKQLKSDELLTKTVAKPSSYQKSKKGNHGSNVRPGTSGSSYGHRNTEKQKGLVIIF